MEHWINTLVQPATLDVHKLGLKAVVPAPMRMSRHDYTPDCVKDVLDWLEASEYVWKVDLEWVWKGHLCKGVCKLAGRQHRRNNRYFRYEAPDIIFIGCHACRKTYRVMVPDRLQVPVRDFLNQRISLEL